MSVTVTPKPEPETRTRKGVKEVRCRWCSEFKAEDREFWMANREGHLYTDQRCRVCQKAYRSELAEAKKAGTREVKTRGSNHARPPKRVTITLDATPDFPRVHMERGPVPFDPPVVEPRRRSTRKAAAKS
jgi:hypothetical protein